MCAWPDNSKVVFHHNMYSMPKQLVLQPQKRMLPHTKNWLPVNACWKAFVIWTGKILSIGKIYNYCFGMQPGKERLFLHAGMHEAVSDVVCTVKGGHSLPAKEFLYHQVFCIWRNTRKKLSHSPYKLLSFILMSNQTFKSVRMSPLTSNRARSVNVDSITVPVVQPQLPNIKYIQQRLSWQYCPRTAA